MDEDIQREMSKYETEYMLEQGHVPEGHKDWPRKHKYTSGYDLCICGGIIDNKTGACFKCGKTKEECAA